MTTDHGGLGSCAEDGGQEEAILILGEVIDQYILIGGQRPRRIEHIDLASLPSRPAGARLVGF